MKKAKFLLFSLLIFSFGIGQDSYEMSLGYNFSAQKIEGSYSGFELLNKEVNGFTFNTSYNFREAKIFSTKLGLSYNFNAIKVDYYTKNDSYQNDGSYVEGWTTKLLKEHRIQLYALSNLNYFDFNAKGFKVNPQIGIIFNGFVKSKYSNSETKYIYSLNKFKYNNYTNLNSKTIFDIDLIFGFQFEKQISAKSSLLFDLNYIRKIDNKNRYFEFYESKNDVRLSLGLKRTLIKKEKVQKPCAIYLSSSIFETFYSFENDRDYFSYPSWVNSINYRTSNIIQKGVSMGFSIEKKGFFLTNDFYISHLDIALNGSREYYFFDKMGNPFLIGQEDKYSFSYQTKKKELEYSFGFGYKLFKNMKFSVTPILGFSFRKRSSPEIKIDEYEHHVYSEYNYFNQPVPEHVLFDTTYNGKASSLFTDTSFFEISPKISLLFNLNIIKKMDLFFRINRYVRAQNNIQFGYIHDTHKYQLSLGVSYKIECK